MKIETGNGKITFNLVDLIHDLDEEGRQDVINVFAWNDDIWQEIKRLANEEYAGPNYNSKIYELRLAFLKGSHVVENISRVVKNLLEEIGRAKNAERDARAELRQWENWWRDEQDAHGTYHRRPIQGQRTDLVFTKEDNGLKFLLENGIVMEEVENPAKEEK